MIYKIWTLFLDRDGVINQRKVGDYIRNWKEFCFLDGVLEAIPVLNKYFDRTVVVTNQQGIAKGLMTEQSLQKIHKKMVQEIEYSSGQIDAVYYCAKHKRENPICRKPNPGMAYTAQKEFSDIQFKQAVMVGDSPSDIQFGKNLGMKTVFLTTRDDIAVHELEVTMEQADLILPQLADLAKEEHLSTLLPDRFSLAD
ncbi:MAG: HAD-IIIA family hydrolase [Saprospiraceae bacterium]|nr:HAD-IIIA family hydrolase [Saprospiraceae bacterium]